jgi:hypothetical protein
MRNLVLEIIVIEPCSHGHYPWKTHVNIDIINQNIFYDVVIMVLF